jgi:hypothetical protein
MTHRLRRTGSTTFANFGSDDTPILTAWRTFMNAPLGKDFLLNLGRIIPAENVRFKASPEKSDAAAEAVTTPAGEFHTHSEPEIVLLKDGDQVKTIVIKCACGQVINLDCEY